VAQFGRSQPIRPAFTHGPVAPGTLFESLTDNFTALDTAKWPGNFGTTSVVAGRARVGVDTGFSGFQSGQLYTIIGSYALVRITTWPAASTATTAAGELIIKSDQVASGTQLDFKADVVTGQLTASNQVGFADGGAVSVAFSTATDLWLRIDGRTPGSITFDYSTTGNPSSWTTLRTITHAAAPWLTTANLGAILQGHRDAGVADFIEFDDFNLGTSDPATPPPIFRPAPWHRQPGQVVWGPKGFHPGEKSPSPIVISPFSGRKPFPLPPPVHLLRGPDLRPAPSATTAVGLDGALAVPLAVRLTSDTADVLLVAEVKDLTFRSVANGGFANATVTLDRPLNVAAPEIEQYGRMYIYDTRTGDTVWEGRLEDPGRQSNQEGRFWQVTAVGPSAHAKDESFPYVPIGTTLNDWEKFGGSTNSSSVTATTDANDVDGIKVQFSGGIAVASPAYVSARLLTVLNAGASLASISTTAVGGGTGQWTEDVYAYGPSGAQLIDSVALTTSPTSFRGEVGIDFSSGQTTPHFRMDRTGASATPDDNAFTFFYNVVIRTTLVTEENVPVASYPDDFVTTTELVQDLIGAHTTEYDGLDAFIQDVADQITQFWYPDGTTVFDALNDIIKLNGAFYWAAWETIPRSGKWRFEFRAWPTTVRYEAGPDDGFTSPGSATDLYNEVSVHWTDAKGRDRTTVRTLANDALTRAGLTRSARIDLGQENGTTASAQAAGDAFLEEHAVPSQSGRLTVARAILDFDRGMQVDPWMIRPGGLMRVRDIAPQANALNPGGRDGNTVFRIKAVEYRASDNSAQLELDTDSITTSRAIAALSARTSGRRHH
jgi:hypothetical protein